MARSETTQHAPGHDAPIHQRGGERRAGRRAQQTQRTTECARQVSLMLVCTSDGWEHGPDARGWDEASQRARRAADRGCDGLWSAVHHGNDDACVPDTLPLLTDLTRALPWRGFWAPSRSACRGACHTARRRAGGRARQAAHGAALPRSRVRLGAARVRRLRQRLDLG